MALAYTIRRRGSAGDLAYRVVDVTLDNNYPAGGWVLSPQSMGFGSTGDIVFALLTGRSGYALVYDHTSDKLRAYQGDNANAAAAPGVELAGASAALNGVVVRILAFGDGHG